MATYNLTEKQILGPIPVTHGSLVRVTPSSGGSVTVEYTKDQESKVFAGTAVWTPWPSGAVSSQREDIARRDCYMRFTVSYGTSVIVINENASIPDDLDNDWESIDFSNGSISIESFGASPSASISENVTAIQSALDIGGQITINTPGVYLIDTTLLMRSGTHLHIGRGVTIKLDTNARRSVLRATNVMLARGSLAIPGITLFYADSQNAGTGTITYNGTTKVMTWTAPGDSAGAGVNVTSGGMFKLPSSSSGKAIYVRVHPNVITASDATRSVTVKGFDGAKSVTLSRTSNVVSVTEVAHGRKRGDVISIRGAETDTSFNGYFFISSVTGANTYTYNSTGSDGSPTGSPTSYGISDISIGGQGSIDQNNQNQIGTSFTGTLEAIGTMFLCISRFDISGITIRNCQKYAICLAGASQYNAHGLRLDTSSDGFHVQGPAEYGGVTDLRGTTGDDFLALLGGGLDTGGYNEYSSITSGPIRHFEAERLHPTHCVGSIVKIVGDKVESEFDALSFRNLRGVTDIYPVNIVTDSVSLPYTKIGTIIVEDVDVSCTDPTHTRVVSITHDANGGTIAIDELIMRDIIFDEPPDGVDNAMLYLYSNIGTISCNKFRIDGFRARKISGSGTARTVKLAYTSGTASVGEGILSNGIADGIHSLIDQASASFTVSTGFQLDNVRIKDLVGGGITYKTSYRVEVSNVRVEGTANGLLTSSSSATCTFVGIPDYVSSGLFNYSGSALLKWRDGNDNFTQTINYAASVTPDPNKGSIITIGTLTNNITVNAPTNPSSGLKMTLIFTQDGTGGRTISWNAVFKKAADGAGTANQKGSISFRYDGSNWVQESGALTWA